MAAAKTKKRWISTLLIVVGGAMILAFLIFQAVNYPWQILFAKWGWVELSEELPDPPPLDAVGPVHLEYGNDVSLAEELPAGAALITARPQITVSWIGVIKLPSIQVSENIVEGSGDELYYGVGHVIGTPMPGQPGNCVMAGHRSYVFMRPFRYLDMVAVGDKVTVSDDANLYTYEVYDMFECGPDDIWVMQPVEEEPYTLTLITCTPVVVHSHRLIVRCRQVDVQPL